MFPNWEPEILKVLRSGRWSSAGGGGLVPDFEAGYAKLIGAKGCVATASGTTALITALHVMGVDAGDEAIASRGFQRLFPAQRLKAYRDSFRELKGNKQVCETTVGMFQSLLLANRSDMDHILAAVRRIQAHSAALAKLA